MFSDNKKGKYPDPTSQQNRISEGTLITGDITSNGGFRIDGTIEGTVSTPNKVVIGKKGLVKGTLTCKDADVEGAINGAVKIENLLSVKSTAKIDGEVSVGKLAVEPGATFNASCDMKGAIKTLENNAKKQGEKRA